MSGVQEQFAKDAPDGAVSKYYGYQDRREIVSDILALKKDNPDVEINLVGHSRGAAVAINIAANELAKAKIEVNLLIAIDPVGNRFTTPDLRIPSGPLWNVRTFIDINASARSGDITDTIARLGGKYGSDARSLTKLYYELNFNHGQASSMIKAPLMIPGGGTTSAMNYLLNDVHQTSGQ